MLEGQISSGDREFEIKKNNDKACIRYVNEFMSNITKIKIFSSRSESESQYKNQLLSLTPDTIETLVEKFVDILSNNPETPKSYQPHLFKNYEFPHVVFNMCMHNKS